MSNLDELLVDANIRQFTYERLRVMSQEDVDVEVPFTAHTFASTAAAPRAFASPTGVPLDPATGLRYGAADSFGIGIAAGN